MSKELLRYKKIKNLKKTILELYEKSDRVLVIHYACESFHDLEKGNTPRVTSIAIRNLESGETKSFNILKIAHNLNIKANKIKKNLDLLEKEMLKSYFKYISKKEDYTFIHWNMRDSNYGFVALEERYEKFGGKPNIVPDNKKFFLGKEIVLLYGKNYIDHGENNIGRFLNLIKFNKITDKDILTGKEEADAFKDERYYVLNLSNLRKVECLATIFNNIAEGTLKTKSKWYETLSFNPIIIVDIIKEHWLWTLFTIITTIFGFIYLF